MNALSNHIICADCGSFYRRAVWIKRDGSKEPVWRCSNKMGNGYNACIDSVTIKENKLFAELRTIILRILKGKGNLHEELSKKVASYVNPKDIIDQKEKISIKIKEVDKDINELLKNDVILMTRGVQDKSQIEEHLEEYNRMKRELMQDLADVEDKLLMIRSCKESKILNILNQMDISNSCFNQSEYAIFIENIVLYRDYAEVQTKMVTMHKIEISRLQGK